MHVNILVVPFTLSEPRTLCFVLRSKAKHAGRIEG